jgi:hypothetical protein
MSPKKRIGLIVLAGFFILLGGVFSSFFWLVKVYLPEQININENARCYSAWYAQDAFIPPADQIISTRQIKAFLDVNGSLEVLLRRLHHQLEENRWRMAIDIIKMQPEWLAYRYQALKKYNLSPREYEWIEKQVFRFWIYRWQEGSLAKLRNYGWEMQMLSAADRIKPPNHALLLEYEKELNRIFDILWPDQELLRSITTDSL